METWIRRERVFTGKFFNVERGTVRLHDGREATRDVVDHPGGVAILPYTKGQVVLVRQYRIAANEYVLEVPAGKLEGNEDPEHRGRVEVEEEAGYRPGRIIPAGSFLPSPGFLTERLYIFLALDLEPVPARPEWDEHIEIVHLPLDEARRRLHADRFDDAKTIIALHALLRFLESGESV
jgi:ADP-ribose pyrophosphatase